MKFEIEAKVENHPNTQLYPGFSAVAEIILDKRDSVLTIKERNLIFKKDSLFVELLDENNKKIKRLVKIGLSDGLRIEITEGLSLKDRVKVQTN
jgi:HlyD family secretion protein